MRAGTSISSDCGSRLRVLCASVVKKAWPHLVFLVVLLVFFRREIFAGELLCMGDVLDQNYPAKAYFREMVLGGRLPLWAPQVSAGLPFLAEGQVGSLYPWHWLFFLPLSVFAAYNLNIILHFIIGFYGAYRFLRSLGLMRHSSLMGGVIFVFSGFPLFHLGHVNMFCVAFYLPYLLYLTDSYLLGRGRAVVNLLVLALLFSVQIFLAHPQFVFYNLVFVVAYFLARLLTGEGKGRGVKALAYFAALAFALLLSAVQFLPTLELAMISRGGGDMLRRIPAMRLNYYLVADLAHQVLPYYHLADNGAPVYSGSYFGILPLLFLPLALVVRRKGLGFFKAALAVSFLLMFKPIAAGLPFFTALTTLGGQLSNPVRLSFYAIFAVSILAAAACEDCFYGRSAVGARKRWLPPLAWSLLALVVVAAAFAPAGVLTRGPLRMVNWQLWMIMLAVLVIVLARLRPDLGKGLAACALGLLICDLLVFGSGRSPYRGEAELERKSSILDSVGEDTRLFSYSYYGLERRDKAEQVPFNSSLLYGVNSFTGYTPLSLKRWREYAVLLEIFLELGLEKKLPLAIAEEMMRSANIAYLTTNARFNHASWRLVSPLGLYRIDSVLPRAFICARPSRAEGKLAAIKGLLGQRYPSSFYAKFVLPLLNTDEAQGAGSLIALERQGRARLLSAGPHELVVEVESAHGGYLVLSDTYYPGWRASVDGVAAEIERANYLFRAVKVGKGEHEVRFLYRPASFLAGLFLTLLSLFVVSLYLGARAARSAHGKRS